MIETMLGYVLAALMVGLWWGERGRRRTVERWLESGTLDEHAPKAVSRVPAQEMEDRLKATSDEAYHEAVDRGVEQMLADAHAQGYDVDADQIRKDVETMLSGQDVPE